MKSLGFYGALFLHWLCFQGKVVGFSRARVPRRKGRPLNIATKMDSASSDAQEAREGGALSRRSMMTASLSATLGLVAASGSIYGNGAGINQNIVTDEDWQGTSLPLLSLEDAFKLTMDAPQEIFPFAHWPDPILRRPAAQLALPLSPDLQSSFLQKIRSVAKTLQRTAHQKRAVGLAAQQCGIDVSLVYLQTNKSNKKLDEGGLFLLNPRIVQRSPERDMLVWTEECLVLPPSFRATLLRDAEVTVEYETIFPALSTQKVTLQGELARALQHEMQHDQGILIVDHVGLEELPVYMHEAEAKGHGDRMVQAFDRAVSPPSLLSLSQASKHTTKAQSPWQELFLPTANAAEPETKCDEACLADRKRRIEERRAMMRQSRTNTRRQDVFELSQQRAVMYNATYRGAQCPPGIPCI